jgi:hypothetical protein
VRCGALLTSMTVNHTAARQLAFEANDPFDGVPLSHGRASFQLRFDNLSGPSWPVVRPPLTGRFNFVFDRRTACIDCVPGQLALPLMGMSSSQQLRTQRERYGRAGRCLATAFVAPDPGDLAIGSGEVCRQSVLQRSKRRRAMRPKDQTSCHLLLGRECGENCWVSFRTSSP